MVAAQEANQSLLIRDYELRLLRCSISSNSTPPPAPQPSDCNGVGDHLRTLIEDVISSIEAGDYIGALSSNAARTIFRLSHFDSTTTTTTSDCAAADKFYSEILPKCVDCFILSDSENGGDQNSRAFLVMAIAVAAFFAFTQCNMTGPLETLPSFPLMALVSEKEKVAGVGGVEWEGWARNQLMAAGSDLFGKFSNLQHIVFTKMLLMRIKDMTAQSNVLPLDGCRSISWWLFRLLFLQQRILDGRSSSLFDLLQVYSHDALQHFGSLERARSYWGDKLEEEEASTIVSMLSLEVGIMEYTYGRVDSSKLHFESAEVASGLQLSVTGALGFRTVHQVEPKAQLKLVTNTSISNGDSTFPPLSSEIQTKATGSSIDDLLQNHPGTHGASDALMTPKFVRDENLSEDIVNVVPLKAIQQAVILAQCLSIEKRTRQDELQRWEMAPYIEAIDSQASSNFIIRCFCDILRIRWESTRSRTKERALLMMETLVQGVYEPLPRVAERITCCYGTYIPTIPALRKEYGELLVSCGLVGEAVQIFEDLELWDNLIYCYSLMEKKAAAVELIKTRLLEMPTDPRLWCSLGDITNNDSCYEKALEVSENRSARAKRSLARSAYNRGEFETSKKLWESAMALNSLYPDGWFALGAAALKARDVDKALDGFTRAVQLDPENGEAWNNIACLHMVKKKNKESFIAFKEALKYKRNSWQLWENFSHVAVDIGNFSQALEAIQMVLDISSNKRIDTELLETIMVEIENRADKKAKAHEAAIEHNLANQVHLADYNANSFKEQTDSEFEQANTREIDHLVMLLGKILKQIIRSGAGAEIWGLYARWHKHTGDLLMCSEALLKQVRSYQGSDLWKDRDRFVKFACASLELCKVYMELSSCKGSRRELLAAKMHLANIVKQGAASCFSDTKELRDIEACLEEVQMKLQEMPEPVPAV